MDVSLTGVSLVVLAGGQGRRLGGAIKPLVVDAAGRTLLERTLSALEPVVGPARLVAPEPLLLRLRRAVDRPSTVDPGRGPPIALAAAAAAIGTDWLLAVAGDLVSPDPRVARYLSGRRREGIDAVVPVVDEYPQPLFALYRTAALRTEPPRSLMLWLAKLQTERWVVSEPADRAALADVDTPADLVRYGLAVSTAAWAPAPATSDDAET